MPPQKKGKGVVPPASGGGEGINAARTAWSLLDPEGVAVVGTTQYSRDTVWFEMRGEATLVLHTSFREVVDPYGSGRTIRLFPEVASTHKDKVLFLLRSPHGAIPPDYFIYSSQAEEDVVRLPDVWPEVLSPESIGLLNSREGEKYSYQVAHLSLKADQNTGLITHGFLHRWKYYPSSTTAPWTHESVQVSLRLNRKKWHTHRVISFDGRGLLWVDLHQGMVYLHHDEPARLDFVSLPKNLPDIGTNPWRHSRPELFRSIGCCKGRLKFVNLHSRPGSNNIVEVDIWTLNLDMRNSIRWRKDYNTNLKLNCGDLWGDLRCTHTHNWLPPWPKSVPIFPILDRDKNNILYLTVAQLNNQEAWLLQIDILTKTLKDVAVYTGYCSHMNPPFPSNLSKYQAPAQKILATSDPR